LRAGELAVCRTGSLITPITGGSEKEQKGGSFLPSLRVCSARKRYSELRGGVDGCFDPKGAKERGKEPASKRLGGGERGKKRKKIPS